MKNKKPLIISVLAAAIVLTLVAADTYLGSFAIVSSIHGETNYLTAVLGNHSASAYRKISPSNLVDVLNANGNYKVGTNGGVVINISNGGQPITVGQIFTVRLPNSFTVKGWTATGSPSGDFAALIAVDTYANFPPTSADEISGTEDPGFTGAIKGQDESLSTWTDITLQEGDFAYAEVTTAATVTNIQIYIYGPYQ